jgi:hypothetical protein
VPKWFRSFRDQRAVWVDIYTKPPDVADYDYVFYVDKEKIKNRTLARAPAADGITSVVSTPLLAEAPPRWAPSL